jgi:hypothetical protein
VSHSLVFQGALQPGVSREQAQARLAQLFKATDSRQLDHFFAGSSVVIKSGLDAAQADRYRQALTEAGLVVEIRNDLADLLDIPPPQKTADGLIITAAPAVPLATPVDASAPLPDPEPAADPLRMWWRLRGTDRHGPYSREELAALALEGELTAADRVWKEGLKNPVAPATLEWLTLSEPFMAEPPPLIAVPDAGRHTAVPRSSMSVAAVPKTSNLVVVLLCLLLPVNVVLGALIAPTTGTTSYRFGYALGAALVWPLLAMLVAALWQSNRHRAAQLRVMMFSSIFVTAILLAQTGTAPGGQFHIREFELSMMSKAANQTLPRMIDKDTRLDDTSASGMTLSYNYTLVNLSVGQLDIDRFVELSRKKLQENVCANTVLTQQMQKGTSYRYHFVDKDRQPLGAITITAADCGLSAS